MGDPFLKEVWGRRAEEERGEKPIEEQHYELFLDVKEKVGSQEELKEFFDQLQESVLRYNASILRLSEAQFTEMSNKDIENADQSRRISHNALIANLDVLSRAFVKSGLDNEWRADIGLGREEASEWARNVAKILKNSVLEKHGFKS